MGTQFTLYALDEADLPAARAQMRGSLGYGGTDITSIIRGAAANQGSIARGDMSPFDVYDRSHFVVERDHTSLHGDDPLCVSHKMAFIIGADLPVIDPAVIAEIVAAADGWADGSLMTAAPEWNDSTLSKPAEWRPRTAVEFADALASWLEGARGRHLWYAFV